MRKLILAAVIALPISAQAGEHLTSVAESVSCKDLIVLERHPSDAVADVIGGIIGQTIQEHALDDTRMNTTLMREIFDRKSMAYIFTEVHKMCFDDLSQKLSTVLGIAYDRRIKILIGQGD